MFEARPGSIVDADCQAIDRLGRGAPTAFCVHELLQNRPIVTIQSVAKALKMPFPTAAAALECLCDAGIAREATGKQLGRIDAYPAYLALLEKGTEPLQI